MKMDFSPQSHEILDQASTWIARIERGLTLSEEARLKTWLSASSDHVEALIELADIWDKSESLSQLAALFPQGSEKPSGPRKYTTWVAVATVLVVALVGVWGPLQSGLFDLGGRFFDDRLHVRQTHETAVGEQKEIVLPDGSRITLNTNTFVTVAFSDKERSVKLRNGEVFVEVAHAEKWPFVVHAGQNLVQAIGTAFNVRMDSVNDVQVIVTEGRVHVEAPMPLDKPGSAAPGPGNSPAFSEKEPLFVAAGEQLVLGRGPGHIRPAPVTEIEGRLSWRTGNLSFRGELLRDALREVERYTTERFVVSEEELNDLRIVGFVRAGDVDGLLFALRENFGVSYQREADGRIVLMRRHE